MKVSLDELVVSLKKLQELQLPIYDGSDNKRTMHIDLKSGIETDHLQSLLSMNSLKLNKNYCELLKIYNGICFSDQNEVFSIERVIDELQENEATGFVPIATFSSDVIYIANNATDDCVYLKYEFSDQIEPLYFSIYDFLDRILIFQTKSFWRYPPFMRLNNRV